MGRAASRRSSRTVSADAAPSYATSRLRRFGVAVLCAKVALVPLVFDFALDMPFTVSKAVLSHGLAYVLAAVMAGLVIRYGRDIFVWSWIHIPVLTFLAVSCLAAIFAADRVLALYGTHARMLGLVSIADGIVLYFAIVLLVRSRAEAFGATIAALGAAGAVLGYEAIQLLGADPFRWSIDSKTRPFSTLGQSTTLAQYLASLAIAALACGLLTERLHPLVRVLVILYAGLLLLGSAATGTRSALIGIATGGAALLLFVWLIHPSARARTLSVVGAVGAVAVLGGLLLLTPLGARLATTLEAPPAEGDEDVLDRLEPSAAGRITLYEIGVQMVAERPILGYGPDNFTVGVPRYRPQGAPTQVRQSVATSAHSWVVQVAATTGLAGLLCFLAIIVVAAVLALRGGFKPAAIAGAATLSAFLGTGLTTVNELGTDWLFWASAGAIAAATATNRLSVQAADRPRRNNRHQKSGQLQIVRRVAPGLLVSASILLALMGWNTLEASRAARASQDARLLGQTQRAIDLGLLATRSDDGRASYWHTLGLAFVGAGRWQDASNAFDRARVLAPYDVRYAVDLVQAQLLLSNTGDSVARSRALQLSDEAVRIDPNNPRPHLTRAVAMQVTGNVAEALRSIERALALDPGSTNARLYVAGAQIMLASNRRADAIRVAREGLALLGRSTSSVPVRIELARALVADGKPAEALAELDIALAIQPTDSVATRLRAEIQASIPR